MAPCRRDALKLLGTGSLAALAGCRSILGSGGETKPWSYEAELAVDDGSNSFGVSVAVSANGTTAIVGAALDDPNGDDSGSAFVFERSDEEWTQQAKLVAEDGTRSDRFGWTVTLTDDGSMAVVGAVFDDDPNGDSAGAAYVFQRSGDSWTQVTKLVAEDGAPNDHFGTSVAVSDDGTIVVGAPGHGRVDAGRAYVFERSDGAWARRAKLTVAGGGTGERFGHATAISGDGTTVVVSASGSPEQGGSVYVFDRAGGSWPRRSSFARDSAADPFGASVAVAETGNTTIVGAPRAERDGSQVRGSAYVFT